MLTDLLNKTEPMAPQEGRKVAAARGWEQLLTDLLNKTKPMAPQEGRKVAAARGREQLLIDLLLCKHSQAQLKRAEI